jgi:hypothetical protein
MEKDYLQSLKIEISKNFKLVPYERIAFHRILALVRSDNGMKILLHELTLDPEIRKSAIIVLKSFNNAAVKNTFMDILAVPGMSTVEKIYILDHLKVTGAPEDMPRILSLVREYINGKEDPVVIARGLEVLREHGNGLKEVVDFIKSISLNAELPEDIRCCAIESYAYFKDISFFEDLVKEKNDKITYSTFKSLAILSDRLMQEVEDKRTEEDASFTYMPELEDKLVLNVRVLLGKMTAQFDSFSKMVRTSFIHAMICCNHREFLIYTMKALTSDDQELIDMVLHLILANVHKLRDPDKLYRNLLALTADTERKNELIVNIFERQFTGMKESRKNNLLKDKLYNYIVVTLETYFETYRKEFMITEVAEKNYPESFQNIRRIILERFNPDIKRKIANFLRSNDRSTLNKVLGEIGQRIPYIEKEDVGRLSVLMEILFDSDAKSRENSSARIDDINFEKRYLRNRILRICDIIGRLKIMEAATTLVKIFNYVKKYQDQYIFDAVAHCLSMLNYSYMQGELEVLLTSAEISDHSKAIRYLSLFSDSRSLNILLDFVKERTTLDESSIAIILNIIVRRDVTANASANMIFRRMIDENPNPEIRRLAIMCMGRCALESDIDYLNTLFFNTADAALKEAIVQAIGTIVTKNTSVNRRQVMKYFVDYLKDPAIKVRIYSCAMLIQLGNKEAMKAIRDMMIIKNKYIQREIISIIGHLKSVEFSYFLISLLKEEYGMTNDIIPVINQLPPEELREIDHFIVNIFKKYETADIGIIEGKEPHVIKAIPRGTRDNEMQEKIFLNVEIHNYRSLVAKMSVPEVIIINKNIENNISKHIMAHKGAICSITDGRLVAVFDDGVAAAETATLIYQGLKAFNMMRLPEKWSKLSLCVVREKITSINEEIQYYPDDAISALHSIQAFNRIIMEKSSQSLIDKQYYCESFPEIIINQTGFFYKPYELISPINFLDLTNMMVNELTKNEHDRIAAQMQLEAELKKNRRDGRTGTTLEYAQAMDEVGKILKDELNELLKYIQKRSTDRELLTNVERMVTNVHKRYLFETTKIIMQ